MFDLPPSHLNTMCLTFCNPHMHSPTHSGLGAYYPIPLLLIPHKGGKRSRLDAFVVVRPFPIQMDNIEFRWAGIGRSWVVVQL